MDCSGIQEICWISESVWIRIIKYLNNLNNERQIFIFVQIGMTCRDVLLRTHETSHAKAKT